jgi:molybdate transport system substrate-binding protein
MGKAWCWRSCRLIIGALTFLLSQSAHASELKVLCIPGLKAAIDTIVPIFEHVSGQTVHLNYEIYAGQKQRIEAGDFDVAIFAKLQIADMMEKQQAVPGSGADITTTSIGVAAKAGARKPDMSNEEQFKGALLAAKSITYTKESSTGVYVTKLLDRLGLMPMLRDKLLLQSGGAMTTLAIANGEADLGIVLVSDILATPGVDLVGPLPPSLQNQVVQSAAIGSAAKNQGPSADFIKFLTAPAAALTFREKGLMPPSGSSNRISASDL